MNSRGLIAAMLCFAMCFRANVKAQAVRPATYKGWDAYNKWIDMPDSRPDNPYVFESEVLSPYARMRPGENFAWQYDWYACRIGGDFPVVDCSDAGVVSEPLAYRRDGDRVRLSGRFGVFHWGRMLLAAYDARSRTLMTNVVDAHATPLRPIVLDRTLKLPATTRSIALILQDTEENTIGEIARSEELRR